MSIIDYIVIAAVVLWASGALYSVLRRRGGCCGSGCTGCSECTCRCEKYKEKKPSRSGRTSHKKV